MRWSARRKLLVIPSTFNFISSKYTSPLSLSSSSSSSILFQTRYLHVNPPNQKQVYGTCPLHQTPSFPSFFLGCGRYLREYMLRHHTKKSHPGSKQVLKILPDSHPHSVRVKWILQDILDALGKNMDMKQDVKATPQHLNGFRWDIFVIDHPSPDAFSFPGGIMYVYTGILQRFNRDDHFYERLTNIICYPMIKLISFFPFNLIPSKIQQLLRYHASYLQVHEREADHIGLILMAWAGYDPRIVPELLEKDAQIRAPSSPITNPFRKKLYPSCERAHFLNQYMGQALDIQNQVKASHRILTRRLGDYV